MGRGHCGRAAHPENRPMGQTLPAVDFSDFELDDYDDDKQSGPDATTLFLPTGTKASPSARSPTSAAPGSRMTRSLTRQPIRTRAAVNPHNRRPDQPARALSQRPRSGFGCRSPISRSPARTCSEASCSSDRAASSLHPHFVRAPALLDSLAIVSGGLRQCRTASSRSASRYSPQSRARVAALQCRTERVGSEIDCSAACFSNW